ncbi:hypothetical protein LCGC14_2777440 [marine sediment metagenome]|uniref:Uncharacterized protein n=1 Tax=marine sediment metagenome TaxID=412755 RepID=A0A0F9B328_9ZZZZ
MKRHLVLLAAMAVTSAAAVRADADWIFQRSTFSHDRTTGKRVDQYAAKKVSYARNDPTYLESGYRHKRTVLRGADGSVDRLHVVQTWGAGEAIRPYGEWQRPYRAGATPYGPWGNPQGPWTTPFESWSNPYGQWNRFPYSPYGYGSGSGSGYGGSGYGGPGYGPGIVHPYPQRAPHGSSQGSRQGSQQGSSHGSSRGSPHGSSHGSSQGVPHGGQHGSPGPAPHGPAPHGPAPQPAPGHGGMHP